MISLKSENRSLNPRLQLKWANLIGALVIAALLIAPATQGRGASESPDAPMVNSPFSPWDTQIVDGPPYFYFMTDRSLRVDKSPNQVPCTAYGGDHLYFSCYNKLTNTWSKEIVDSATMVGSYAALDFNNQNIPFITYYDALNATLKLAYKVGIGWSTMVVDDGASAPPTPTPTDGPESSEPENLSPEQLQEADTTYWEQLLEFFPYLRLYAPGFLNSKVGVGKHSSIDIASNNVIHISYYDQLHGALKYAYWDGSTLQPVPEFVDWGHQSDMGLWTSIVVDDWFRPQISYMDEKYDDLRYAIKMGPTWDRKLVDNGVNVGPFSSITLLKNSNYPFNPRLTPFIVYMAFNYNTPQFALKHARLQNDNVTWTRGTIDPSLGVGLFASIAKAADDRLHVSYYDGLKGDLKYATSANGTNWNVRTLITTGDQGMFSSIDIGWDDEPVITHFDSTNGALKFIYKDGANWINTSPPIGWASNVGLNTSLAINDTGIPYISYLNETKGWLKHAQWAGSNWLTETVTTTASLGTFHSIGLLYKNLPNSLPQVAFYDVSHGDLILSSRIGTTWVDDFVDRYDDVGSFVSMEVDMFNIPHLSYVNATWDLLNYAKWDVSASDWSTSTVDYFDVGGYTSIAIDGNSLFGSLKPGISYFDFVQEQVRYAYQTPFEVWQNMAVAPIGNPDDKDPILEPYNSIDYDSSNLPHVVYYDEVYGDLMYTSFNGTQWSTPLRLDGDGIAEIEGVPGVDVGRYAQLVINKMNNHRHICYYDSVQKDLKYLYWDGTTWYSDIVDGIGDVGMYCSIDLNGAGTPGISYYDASNADLKFAFGQGYSYNYRIFLPVSIR